MMMCLTFLMSPLANACLAVNAVRAITTIAARNNRYSLIVILLLRLLCGPSYLLLQIALFSLKFPGLAHPHLSLPRDTTSTISGNASGAVRHSRFVVLCRVARACCPRKRCYLPSRA